MTEINDPYLHSWPELELTLEWCPRFSLFFVFTKTQKDTALMRGRLERLFDAASTSLTIVKPKQFAGDTQNTHLFDQIFNMNIGDPRPCWIALDEVFLSEGERLSFMATLNKRRTQIEVQLNRPVFIALPIECAPNIVDWAPDLWTIRQQLILPD